MRSYAQLYWLIYYPDWYLCILGTNQGSSAHKEAGTCKARTLLNFVNTGLLYNTLFP
eukprot:SAG11_NODE_36228_length_262_cov_2.134969_1_plen_56_part_01